MVKFENVRDAWQLVFHSDLIEIGGFDKKSPFWPVFTLKLMIYALKLDLGCEFTAFFDQKMEFLLKISFLRGVDRNTVEFHKVTSSWFPWRELMVLNFYQLVPFVIPPSVRDNNCWLNNNYLHQCTMNVCVSSVCKYRILKILSNL